MAVELFYEKLALSGTLLVVTVLCSVAPWMLKSKLGKDFSTVLRYMNTLAGGVVMGALLLHMIPELFHQHGTPVHVHAHGHHDHGHHGHAHAHHDHHGHNHDHHGHNHDHKHHHDHKHAQEAGKGGVLSFLTLTDHYPWGCFAAGISFLFLFYVDRIFFGDEGCHDGHHHGHSHGHSHSHSHSHAKQVTSKTDCHDHHDHSHEDGADSCCNGHQGNGHQSKPNVTAKQAIIQLSANSTPRIISLEKEPPKLSQVHQHELVGGCHMDSITGASSQTQTMVFVFALSLHSYLEGLGAAGQCDWSGLCQFAFSLLGHKLLEAFALGVSVMRAGFSATRTAAILSFYSFLTPLGILSGMGALRAVSSSTHTKLIVELLNGAAVGSFMFVGMIEMIPPEFNSYDPVHSKNKFAVLCAGFLVMAAMNAFGHQH